MILIYISLTFPCHNGRIKPKVPNETYQTVFTFHFNIEFHTFSKRLYEKTRDTCVYR